MEKALKPFLHPPLADNYRKWLEEQKHPFVLKVAALLFEADIARQLDFTALVISPASLKKDRLAVRDPQRSSSQVEAIMASQLSDEDKIKQADFAIYNDEKHSLISQAFLLSEKIKTMLPG